MSRLGDWWQREWAPTDAIQPEFRWEERAGAFHLNCPAGHVTYAPPRVPPGPWVRDITSFRNDWINRFARLAAGGGMRVGWRAGTPSAYYWLYAALLGSRRHVRLEASWRARLVLVPRILWLGLWLRCFRRRWEVVA